MVMHVDPPTTTTLDDASDRLAVYGLYRFYSLPLPELGIPAGARLYVGQTTRDFNERWQEEASAPWWRLIDWPRTEAVLLNGGRPMRHRDALRVEENEIRAYDRVRGVPGTLANKVHNGDAGAELERRLLALDVPSGPAMPITGGPPPGAAELAWLGDVLPKAAALAAVVGAGAVLIASALM